MTIQFYKKVSGDNYLGYGVNGDLYGFSSQTAQYNGYLEWVSAGGNSVLPTYVFAGTNITLPDASILPVKGFSVALSYKYENGQWVENIDLFKQQIIEAFKGLVLEIFPYTDKISKDANNGVKREVAYYTNLYTITLRNLRSTGLDSAFASKNTASEIIATEISLVPAAPTLKVLSPLEFLETLTEEEFDDILAHILNDSNTIAGRVALLKFIIFFSGATQIKMNSEKLAGGLGFISSLGLLDNSRIAEIIAGVKKTTIQEE